MLIHDDYISLAWNGKNYVSLYALPATRPTQFIYGTLAYPKSYIQLKVMRPGYKDIALSHDKISDLLCTYYNLSTHNFILSEFSLPSWFLRSI